MAVAKNQMTELAWAAGFFDGEGSIGAYLAGAQGKHKMLQVTCAQKRPEPIERFYAVVGIGSVTQYQQKGKSISKSGSYPLLTKWAAYGTKARLVLDMLWPYLSAPKKEKALETGQYQPKEEEEVTQIG